MVILVNVNNIKGSSHSRRHESTLRKSFWKRCLLRCWLGWRLYSKAASRQDEQLRSKLAAWAEHYMLITEKKKLLQTVIVRSLEHWNVTNIQQHHSSGIFSTFLGFVKSIINQSINASFPHGIGWQQGYARHSGPEPVSPSSFISFLWSQLQGCGTTRSKAVIFPSTRVFQNKACHVILSPGLRRVWPIHLQFCDQIKFRIQRYKGTNHLSYWQQQEHVSSLNIFEQDIHINLLRSTWLSIHVRSITKVSTSFCCGYDEYASHLCRVAGITVWSHMTCEF